jgi:hypothetical protein
MTDDIKYNASPIRESESGTTGNRSEGMRRARASHKRETFHKQSQRIRPASIFGAGLIFIFVANIFEFHIIFLRQ